MKEGIFASNSECALPSTGSAPETAQHGTPAPRLMLSGAESLLPAVRRQLEVSEEWVKTQLTRQQQQSEILVDRALRRIEARMQALDSDQDKLEMGVAQQGGGLKGLTDEFAAQALRMDALETRQWDWRQSVEESLRARINDLERQLKNCATNAFQQCVTNEEAICRESARLRVLEERAGGFDLGSGRMFQLEEHVLTMTREMEHLEQIVGAFDPGKVAACEEVQWEQRAAAVAAKVDPLLKEMGTIKGVAHEQDMRLSILRVCLNTQESRTQGIAERMEAIDMHGPLKRVPEHGRMDLTTGPLAPRALFEDHGAAPVHAAAFQVHAEHWLHGKDEPVQNLGVLSLSGRATPADEGRRELLGLCETARVEDSEEGEEE